MARHLLGPEAVHTAWDAALPPVLRVRPGDTVELVTLDASHGAVARQVAAGEFPELTGDLRAVVAASAYPEGARTAGLRGHPLCGPVYVEGAQPGDTLVAEILEVRPAAWGWTGCRPNGIGLLDHELADELEGGYTHFWDLRAGIHADFLTGPGGPGIRLPLAPFPGVIGLAPGAPGPHSTAPPRQVGGNMDVRQLVAGSTLYLPVEVPGALLSAGDLHAAQGDGELSGTGIEMEGRLTLRLSLRSDWPIESPQLRTPPEPTGLWTGGAFAVTGHDPDLMTAARTALRGLLAHMRREYGLSTRHAYVLSSACVDLRISQIVDAPNYTVSALLPLSIFS